MTQEKMDNVIDNEVTKEVHNEVPDVIGALFDERDLPSSERGQSAVEKEPKIKDSSPKEKNEIIKPEEIEIESTPTFLTEIPQQDDLKNEFI